MNKLFYLFVFFLIGCGEGTSDLPVLDFAAALQQPRDFDLSEIAEKVTYVKLETREDCLLDGMEIEKKGDNLYIRTGNYFDGRLYRFSMDGKFICPIGNLGGGPEEYSELLYSAVSPDGKNIYAATRHDILKYNSAGEFIKRIPFEEKTGHGISPFLIDRNNRFFFRLPEAAFIKSAVLVFDVDFNLLCDYKRQVVRNNEGIVPIHQSITYDGENIYYQEPLHDTLYAINGALVRKPVAILDLGSEQPGQDAFDSYQKLTGKRLLDFSMFTSQVWVFRSTNAFPEKYTDWFIYLKRFSELIYLKHPAIRWENIDWEPSGSTSDEWILEADMVSLLENRDKITDPELKRMAFSVNENSNSILMVVKLK